MIWALLGLSEASLGPLRSVSWAAQKAPETLKNAVFELPDRSGRAAALPGPRREVPGAENHPNHGMISARVGMIWAKSSYHPSCLTTLDSVVFVFVCCTRVWGACGAKGRLQIKGLANSVPSALCFDDVFEFGPLIVLHSRLNSVRFGVKYRWPV